MSNQNNESHDWFGDAAESLVRYCFVKEGFFAYGSSKWGADCIIEDMKSGRKLSVEVKSTDRSNRTHTQLVKTLKKKLNKSVKPDIYAEVRLESRPTIKDGFPISISLWKIDKDNGCLVKHSKLSDFRNGAISRWTEEYFKV